jgi:hypothetical protein
VQCGNLRVNGKNESFSCWSIFTDADNSSSKWLPENCKRLRNVLAKIEGLNIFEKNFTGDTSQQTKATFAYGDQGSRSKVTRYIHFNLTIFQRSHLA